MGDLTVLAYSANREHPTFEGRLREVWRAACGDLPIVSVTQQPMPDLGHNVCVGDVGVSGFNMFRQTQVGLRLVTTPSVVCVEADCLYPPSQFTFVPPTQDRCYRNRQTYVMPQHRALYWHKPESATHAQVIGRDFYLATLDRLLAGAPEWSVAERNFPKERHRQDDVFTADEIGYWDGDPVVQIKTSDSMRHYTRSERQDIPTVPLWGAARDVRRQYGPV